jgi:hypothetical protein
MPLTPGAQINELRRAIGESERRRQAAEVKLADCERRLGTRRQNDRRTRPPNRLAYIRSRSTARGAASTVTADYARDATLFFSAPPLLYTFACVYRHTS